MIGPRRIPALQTFLFAWLGVLLLAGILRDRAGVRFGMRIGGLALMWLPALVLLGAALRPSEQAELFLIAGGSFALALLTDRLVPWPRGPAVPTIVALVAYTADLANHSHLVIRSLLGPSPRSGSRFYGFGNELEIAMTIVLLVALAAVLRHRGRTRGNALAFALGGLALAAVVGSGRLGADVGGIFTIAGGAAVATLMLLPGGVTKRALAIAVATPLAGLAALAALDLATGRQRPLRAQRPARRLGRPARHVRAPLRARLVDRLQRLRAAADDPLRARGRLRAASTATASTRRSRGDAVWRAALAGGLAASLAGSLFNDSGPLLLFVGIVSLGFVTAYLRAAPETRAEPPVAEASPSATLVANGYASPTA